MTIPSVGYVVNVPVKIDSDSEDTTTSGNEQTDEFPADYFKKPLSHFRIFPKPAKKNSRWLRGKVSKNNVQPINSDSQPPSKIAALMRQFAEESFTSSTDESQKHQKKRLRTVFGLNKMRSLSYSRNQGLGRAVKICTTNLHASAFGFFWDGIYQENTSQSPKSDHWTPCSFERVQQFYKQLKKNSPNLANKFLKKLENKRSHLVPYRAIRERLSQSPETRNSVRALRNDHKLNRIFLGIFDDDSISLRTPDGRGVFSHYDEMVEKNHKLEVASCGYSFTGQKHADSPEDPIMKVASEADMRIRHATAKFFAYGVYYAEPNMIINIPADKDTIDYSFTNGEEHYKSPNESVIILEQIRKRFKGDQSRAAFNGYGTIPTTTPRRAEKSFEAHYNHYKKIVRWTERDFKRIRGVRQSHLHPNKWANNLYPDLDHNDRDITLESGEKISFKKGCSRRIVISLISRLFNHYDVISIALDRLTEQIKKEPNAAAFPKQLIDILNKYEPALAPLKKIIRAPCDAKNASKNFWRKLDNIDTLSKLKEALALFLDKEVVDRLENAAKNSGQRVFELFRSRFELRYDHLTLGLMQDFLIELNPPLKKRPLDYPHSDTAAYQILQGNTLNDKGQFKASFRLLLKQEKDQKDSFHITPMHWAAMHGDTNLIKKLKALNRELQCYASIRNVTKGGATPLHCALFYCSINASDAKLIEELLDDQTAVAPTSRGVRPLIMALEELENPLTIVTLLCRYNVLNETNKKSLLSILGKFHAVQLGDSLLNSLILHLPEKELPLLQELIALGLNVRASGYALKDEDIQEFQEELQTVNIGALTGVLRADPVPLAVRRKDVTLVKLMIERKAKVNECYDENGNTPVMAAILHLENPVPMLEMLFDLGAEVLEFNSGNEPPPLRYLVEQDPTNKKLLKLLLKKARQEEGFAEFFFEPGISGHGGIFEFFATEYEDIAYEYACQYSDDQSLEKETRAMLRLYSGKSEDFESSSSESSERSSMLSSY